MIKSKYINIICIGAAALAALLTLLLMILSGAAQKLQPAGSFSSSPEYAGRLFDPDRVHTIDIRIGDWAGFLQNAGKEEYVSCTLVIDGEEFSQVGLRAKGNNSLRLTREYGLSATASRPNSIIFWTAGITTAWTSFPWTLPFRITAI